MKIHQGVEYVMLAIGGATRSAKANHDSFNEGGTGDLLRDGVKQSGEFLI